MAEGLQIQISANVSNAVQGLNQVQSELDQTSKGAASLGSAVNQAASTLNKLPQTANQAGTAVNNLSRIVQDAPFGFIAISNNLQPLFDDFTRLKGQTGSVGGALKALTGALTGPAGIGLAFAAATSLITVFSKEIFSSGEAAKKTKTDADNLRDSIKGIYGETAKEASAVNGFIAILNSETETRQRKLSAIKELQAIQPDIFNGLKLEGEAVVGLDAAYQNYIQNLKTVLAVKIKQAQQEQLIEKLLRAEGVTLTANEKLLADGTKKLQQSIANDPRLGPEAGRVNQYYKDQEAASKNATDKLRKDIENLQADITTLSAGIKTSPIALKEEKVKFDFTPIVGFRKLTIEEGELAKQFEIGIITKAYEKKIKEGFKTLKPIPVKVQIAPEITQEQENFKKLQDQFTENFKAIGSAVQSVLAPAFQSLFDNISKGTDVLGGFFEGLKQGVSQLIQSLLQTAAIAGVISLITGTPFSLNFKALSGIGLPGRASGGPVSGGNPYVVGEKGPELFIPSVSGSIVPNNSVGSFMGGRIGDSGRGTTLRGQDIILAYARTQRSQLRVNG